MQNPPTIVYIYCKTDARHRELAFNFVNSYLEHPPGHEHKTVVVCQGDRPDWNAQGIFDRLPRVAYYDHDDSGWDIGAFIAVAKVLDDAPFMVCFGGTAHFWRRDWLKRMAEVWAKHGEGFYGGKATYEISPHLNTCGFWTSPKLLAGYPINVIGKRERYNFEHGPDALWKMLALQGYPCKYATWTEELDWQDWRKPENGFRRGNQSDCLTRWWLNKQYDSADPHTKKVLQNSSDSMSDQFFKMLMDPKTPDVSRTRMMRLSMDRLCRIHKFK